MDLEPGKLYRFKTWNSRYSRDSEGRVNNGIIYFEENDFCFILSHHYVKFTSRDLYRILMKNKIYYVELNFELLEEV